jgi:predicted XRE-type DNA-binding protein
MTHDELRAWIETRQMTQPQAADVLGVSLATLSRQINGHFPVSRQTEIIVRLLTQEAGAVE